MSIRIEPKLYENEKITDYMMRLAAVRNWCSENLHHRKGGQWDVLDINLESIRGGGSILDVCYFEFADPEVASLVALKFGL